MSRRSEQAIRSWIRRVFSGVIFLLVLTTFRALPVAAQDASSRDYTPPHAPGIAESNPEPAEEPGDAPAPPPTVVTPFGSPRPALPHVTPFGPPRGAAPRPPSPQAAIPVPQPAAQAGEAAEPAGGEPGVLGGAVSVEVGADQRTTVSGESPSLRAVIEEICHQAGVQLRTYAAADRKYVGHLENVPLSQALRSMLRTESYLVGVRSDKASPQERITWLRVLGGEGGTPGAAGVSGGHFARAQPTPAAQPQGDNKFMVSSSLLFQAFGTFDPQRREQAQREILSRIAEPEQMSRFLSSDPKEMAKVMGRYRNSAQTIRQMQGMADRPDVQAKLEEIAAEVERQAQDHP